MSGVTYDAGALIALERETRSVAALHRRLLERGIVPVVPAGVLAQVWRDPARQAALAKVLRGCRVEALDDAQARRVGRLTRTTGSAEVVDLSVAEGALRRADMVVTSDPDDIAVCGVPQDAIHRV